MREIRNAVDQPLQTDIRLGLTQRQQEVLHLMSKGRSNKEIARALDIAPGTVKVHINAAFRTLGRSEEHTSELQSLMRISYAVFCLKKKKNNNDQLLSTTTHI